MRRINCTRFFPIVLVTMLSGGCATPTRYVYRSKMDTSNTVTYLSKAQPPLKLEIPGTYWKTSALGYNHIILANTKQPPRRIINIFEYDDGALRQRFYKPGFSEEQAVEEYSLAESKYQSSKRPAFQYRIIERNLAGPVSPNLLWSLESERDRIFFLTMSKDRHLISLSVQDLDEPARAQEVILEMFRSITFLTREKADYILRTETNP